MQSVVPAGREMTWIRAPVPSEILLMIFPSRPMMEPTAEPGTMSRKAFWPGHPGHFSAGFLPLAEATVGSTEAIDSDEMRRRNRCCWCSRSGECCEKSRETARKWEFIWITLVRNVADVGPTPHFAHFETFYGNVYGMGRVDRTQRPEISGYNENGLYCKDRIAFWFF